MAVVQGPLHSDSATGTLGGQITFDKRGFVRKRVTPANPKTDAQGNVRQIILAVQKALTVLGDTVIAAVKPVVPTSYRWNAFLLQAVIGTGGEDYAASKSAFEAMTSDQRGDWDDAAGGIGIDERSLDYAGDDPISAGLALFAVSRALFALGLNTSAMTPGTANSGTWATYFAS